MTSYGMRISDWSSDVCSSDLTMMKRRSIDSVKQRTAAGDARRCASACGWGAGGPAPRTLESCTAAGARPGGCFHAPTKTRKRDEWGQSVSARFYNGGMHNIKKKNNNKQVN